MNSFFDTTTTVKRSLPLLPACGECGLFKTCQSQKMKPTGKGKRKILIVGEAPGAQEDRRGRQFVGETGRLLRTTLRGLGVNPDVDCIWTNAIICRPPNNRIPNENTVSYCRANLIRTIEEYKPEVILLLGNAAVESLIGWLWTSKPGGISKWMGFRIPSQRLNAWICPTWHPSYVNRDLEVSREKKRNSVVQVIWRKHLRAALKLTGRPYRYNAPRFEEKIQTILDTSRAATLLLKRFNKQSRPIAFDFETDRLKPDHKDAQVVSCSISDGKYTIAYPWHGEAITATKKILESDVPKIGYNIKFEERWARTNGIKIKNWVFDGQLAAHIVDNRPYITSLKFQAFVMLGQEDYNSEIKSYLESKEKGGNSVNRIKQASIEKVLKYNGMDALLERILGKVYMRKIGLWKKDWT